MLLACEQQSSFNIIFSVVLWMLFKLSFIHHTRGINFCLLIRVLYLCCILFHYPLNYEFIQKNEIKMKNLGVFILHWKRQAQKITIQFNCLKFETLYLCIIFFKYYKVTLKIVFETQLTQDKKKFQDPRGSKLCHNWIYGTDRSLF